MIRTLLALIFSLMFISPVQAETEPTSTGCGVERWSLKTLTDVDAPKVNLHPVWASIGHLDSLPAPATLPANHRIPPVELTTYYVNVTLVKAKLEADSDFHLVIQGTSGNHMIAEIPSPQCVEANSPVYGAIATARSTFAAKYAVGTTWRTINQPVKLFGVGYFDYNHGQAGVAPNAIELHPVIKVTFPQ